MDPWGTPASRSSFPDRHKHRQPAFFLSHSFPPITQIFHKILETSEKSCENNTLQLFTKTSISTSTRSSRSLSQIVLLSPQLLIIAEKILSWKHYTPTPPPPNSFSFAICFQRFTGRSNLSTSTIPNTNRLLGSPK